MTTAETGTRIKLVPPDTRPHIPIGVDLERMTNDAISSLSRDERVYQRAGMLSFAEDYYKKACLLDPSDAFAAARLKVLKELMRTP